MTHLEMVLGPSAAGAVLPAETDSASPAARESNLSSYLQTQGAGNKIPGKAKLSKRYDSIQIPHPS